ncbi:Aldolase-type TIM barrel [Penicillium atrosanguineum]|uniref:Aldolase-type TIM barrel n=1 Tax=Penicillium atrosanguineum TaxID=1132637 RepID=A0A9W9PMZ4_9EURO|nr:Aldolase-type TIM barrel [Penicillium atrosanguineum]
MKNEVYQAGLKSKKPSITFNSLKYTNSKNAFKKWRNCAITIGQEWLPRQKRSLFGETYDYPIAIVPVGVQRIIHTDGETATVKAAQQEHVTYILSTASAPSIEDVAKAKGSGSRWYQLYWPLNKDNDISVSFLSRAKAAGYKVLVVTLDTYLLGWRPNNIGVALGSSDPVYRSKFQEKHVKTIEVDIETAATEWKQIGSPGFSHSWEDIKFMSTLSCDGIQASGVEKDSTGHFN